MPVSPHMSWASDTPTSAHSERRAPSIAFTQAALPDHLNLFAPMATSQLWATSEIPTTAHRHGRERVVDTHDEASGAPDRAEREAGEQRRLRAGVLTAEPLAWRAQLSVMKPLSRHSSPFVGPSVRS
jgi:hypothetical protein